MNRLWLLAVKQASSSMIKLFNEPFIVELLEGNSIADGFILLYQSSLVEVIKDLVNLKRKIPLHRLSELFYLSITTSNRFMNFLTNFRELFTDQDMHQWVLEAPHHINADRNVVAFLSHFH